MPLLPGKAGGGRTTWAHVGKAEVLERTRALVVGRAQRRDGEAERGAEVLRYSGHAVGDGAQREEPGSTAQTAQTLVDHLDKGNLGLGKARL
jgi:hypothetical protein